jgi:tetratricopeptide (TPR) repeat protein
VSGCKGRAYVVGELIYTLRAIPNHHRALMTAIEYSLLPARKQPKPLEPPPECWLERAMAFSPRDPNTRVIYGIYLHRKGHLDDARKMYNEAIKLAPRLAEAHYNLAILLVDRSEFEKAREHARVAYELGYPLQGLRQRLTALGFPP